MHDRQIARHFQRELVAIFTVSLGGGQRGLHDIRRHAIQLIQRGIVGISIGCIQRVFAKFLAQFSLLFLDGCKALAGCTHQFCAAQYEVANGVFVSLALFGVEHRHVDGLVFGVQPLVGTQASEKFGDFRQGFVVGGTQFGRVGHAVQVAYSTPGAAEFLGGHIQHFCDVGPARRKIGMGYGLECGAGVYQQHVNRRGHMLRGNAVKQREV